MNNKITQNDILKAWAKMKLNSSYGSHPISVIPVEYDENEARQVAEEGKKILMLIQDAVKNVA